MCRLALSGTLILQTSVASGKSLGNNTPRYVSFSQDTYIKNNKNKDSPVKATRSFVTILLCMVSLLASTTLMAANQAGLDASIEELKAEVVELNQELFELEEQLLYPATTSFAVYVSMTSVDNFDIQSIKLNLDEQDVTSYLYSQQQVKALRRGGIQKIFTGNLKPGLHKIIAEIQGKDQDGRTLKRSVLAEFGKARSSKYLEVKISHNPEQNRPDFAIVEWK